MAAKVDTKGAWNVGLRLSIEDPFSKRRAARKRAESVSSAAHSDTEAAHRLAGVTSRPP
jgi:hypothetical protein